jgi:DNA repair exonuclease SbcCD nuclease subunit
MSLSVLIIFFTSVLAGLTFWQDIDRKFYDDLVKKLHEPAPICQEECVNPMSQDEEHILLAGGIYDRSTDLP